MITIKIIEFSLESIRFNRRGIRKKLKEEKGYILSLYLIVTLVLVRN